MTSSRAETRDVHPVAMTADDLDDVLELNNSCVPHVNELDRDRLARIHEQCSMALVIREPAGLAAVVMVLAPGADYSSPNYRFFCDRYADFRYVDRIAVSAQHRRVGHAAAMYDAVFDHARSAGSPRVVCEVNVDPPNPDSMAMHRGLGFTEVERQSTYGDTVTVALLGAELS